MSNDQDFGTIELKSWSQARQLTDLLRLPNDVYIFRGHRSADWKLETTLERLGPKYVGADWMNYFNNNAGTNLADALANAPFAYRDLRDAETRIIEKFKRSAGIYLKTIPNSKIEWLSWIQHYGGPTRLLDFTYSFYAAVFFAIENAGNDAAVWAINLHETDKWAENIKQEQKNLKNLTLEELDSMPPLSGMLRAEPKNLHERMAGQQALFLCPCDISKPFIKNLAVSLNKQPDDFKDDNGCKISLGSLVEGYEPGRTNIQLPKVLKIVLPFHIHDDAMRDLEQMNITAASLFPGLDGFARSLNQDFRKYRFVLPMQTKSTQQKGTN